MSFLSKNEPENTHHGASTDLNVTQDGSHGIVDLGLDSHSVGDDDASQAKKLGKDLDAVTTSTINDDVKGLTVGKVLKMRTPLVCAVDINGCKVTRVSNALLFASTGNEVNTIVGIM